MTDRAQWLASKATYMKKDMYPPGQGENLTIRDVRDQAFSRTDGTSEHKLVIDWKEERPSLALNKTNTAWLIGTFGADDDNWIRKQVFVFHDPTVKYAGKPIGGLVLDTAKEDGPDPELKARLSRSIKSATGLKDSAPKKKTPVTYPEPWCEEPLDDDIPF